MIETRLKSVYILCSTRLFASLLILVLAGLSTTDISAQAAPPAVEISSSFKQRLQLTGLGFGGIGLKISSFNGHFGIMSGGKGYATLNQKFTVGGGGYGLINRIPLDSDDPAVCNYFKMGYGGMELGYNFAGSKRFHVGFNVLTGAGAAFMQSIPEELTAGGYSIFAVFEPSLNADFNLNRMIKLNAGLTYRMAGGKYTTWMPEKGIRGPSVYFAILFGTRSGEVK